VNDILTLCQPEGWKLYRLGQLFEERKEKVSDKDYPPLSVTMGGIVPQLDTAAKSDDSDNRKLVRRGDYAINSRSDRKGSGGVSELEGSVSLITIVLKLRGVVPRFAHHLLRSTAFQEEFYRWGHGIVADLWTTRFADMKNIRLFLPNIKTQGAIADFLDRETARVDQLTRNSTRFLELVRERQSAKIASILLGGASRQTQWLTNIPSGWKVERAKFHFRECQDRSLNGQEELLTVSHITGVTKRADKDVNMFLAENNEGYKLVQPGDLVINTMWAWMGAMGVSPEHGLISPSYGIHRPYSGELRSDFVDLLVRSKQFVAEATRRSKGSLSENARPPGEHQFLRIHCDPEKCHARTLWHQESGWTAASLSPLFNASGYRGGLHSRRSPELYAL
jgi:type I restriction enzyme S subunit